MSIFSECNNSLRVPQGCWSLDLFVFGVIFEIKGRKITLILPVMRRSVRPFPIAREDFRLAKIRFPTRNLGPIVASILGVIGRPCGKRKSNTHGENGMTYTPCYPPIFEQNRQKVEFHNVQGCSPKSAYGVVAGFAIVRIPVNSWN